MCHVRGLKNTLFFSLLSFEMTNIGKKWILLKGFLAGEGLLLKG
jgi:hypothetical protein